VTRIENIGDCTLYLGDCREILPTLGKVDAVVTDPVWPNCPPDLLVGGDDPNGLWRDTWTAMPELTRAVVVMRHDSDPRFLAPVPMPYLRATILGYVMPGYTGRFLGGDEIAYSFGQPIPSREGQRVIPGRGPVVQPDGRAANGHPCSRALAHFEFLVRWWSEPGEAVLDPFMGSGTTGVACQKLGRKFIGIEIEERYFNIACRRIEEAMRQPDMFVEAAKPAAVQLDLMDAAE
jgi:site-specific DNA-methyltransferase (adenine-specific)